MTETRENLPFDSKVQLLKDFWDKKERLKDLEKKEIEVEELRQDYLTRASNLETNAKSLLNKELSPEELEEELNNLKLLFKNADLPNTFELLMEIAGQLWNINDIFENSDYDFEDIPIDSRPSSRSSNYSSVPPGEELKKIKELRQEIKFHSKQADNYLQRLNLLEAENDNKDLEIKELKKEIRRLKRGNDPFTPLENDTESESSSGRTSPAGSEEEPKSSKEESDGEGSGNKPVKNTDYYRQEVLIYLNNWKDWNREQIAEDGDNAVEKEEIELLDLTIQTLNNPQKTADQQLKAVDHFFEGWGQYESDESDTDSIREWHSICDKLADAIKEWKKYEKVEEFESESESEEEENNTDKTDWFTPEHWLTDAEIDWAMEQIQQEITNSYELAQKKLKGEIPWESWETEEGIKKYIKELEKKKGNKIIPAMTFYYIKVAGHTADADAYMSFPLLLSDLSSFKGDFVFIPVNNPDTHWSLLVYEAFNGHFYHFDTSSGINYEYARPIVEDLLKQIHRKNNEEWEKINLDDYLIKKHDIKQGNNSDCGVAVIALTERIIKQGLNADFSDFKDKPEPFKSERLKWRTKLALEP